MFLIIHEDSIWDLWIQFLERYINRLPKVERLTYKGREMRQICCAELCNHIDGKDVPIKYSEKFREYGILITDGGTATQLIHYCPWCGQKLPVSLRDTWFSIIESMGLELSNQLPSEFYTSLWWEQRRL